jgi:hypothetical protein
MKTHSWDVNLGYRMWCEGLPRKVIAERFGVTVGAVSKKARRDNWPRRRFSQRYPGKIEVEARVFTRRCPRCLSIYRSTRDGHCNAPVQSLYEVAA